MDDQQLRLMTYNIGKGRKDLSLKIDGILETICQVAPDVLVVQECVEWVDADGVKYSDAVKIATACGFGSSYFFGETLSMRANLQINKATMLHGLYDDWQDWMYGNAIFSRHGFVRLSEAGKPGTPRNVPIYRPPVYEGNRDTDPRYALLARLPYSPAFPYVIGVHLTTLLGERGAPAQQIPFKANEAQKLRLQQARQLLALARPKSASNELIFLLGDFNAMPQEACLVDVLQGEGGFMRLVPKADIQTHPEVPAAVDHIFVSPASRILEYNCWVVDSATATTSSDHLPVIADVAYC